MLLNSSLATAAVQKNIRINAHPFTDIAADLGNVKVANMVALGCLIAQKKITQSKTIEKVISEIAPPDKLDLIAINQRALKEGLKLG